MGHRPNVYISRAGGPTGITTEIRIFAPEGTGAETVAAALKTAVEEAFDGIAKQPAWQHYLDNGGRP